MTSLAMFAIEDQELDTVNGGLLPLIFLLGVLVGAGGAYLIDKASGG